MKTDYGNNYPSVTQVLGVLRKIGLENWFKYNTPDFIKSETDKAKDIGTLTHEVIQKHIELEKIQVETVYPVEVKNCIEGFFLFKKDHPEIKLKRAEILLTSEIYKFNGTLDCSAKEKNEIIVVDWKTGKCDVGKVDKYGKSQEKEMPPIYPEMEYQISAYAVAYNEMFNVNIEKAGIIVLAKDKISYNFLIISKNVIDKHFENMFLTALKQYNYQNKTKGGFENGKRI